MQRHVERLLTIEIQTAGDSTQTAMTRQPKGSKTSQTKFFLQFHEIFELFQNSGKRLVKLVEVFREHRFEL